MKQTSMSHDSFLMFFGQLTVYKRFFNQRKLFEVLSLDGILFIPDGADWSLQFGPETASKWTLDSWMGYHARCVVVRQWYSVQPTNLSYQKL